MPRMLVRMLPHGHNAINRARALLTARLVPRNRRLRPRATWSMARLQAAQARRAACAWRGILNHRHLLGATGLWGWLRRRVFSRRGRDPMLGRRGNTPMGARAARVLLATAACLLWLNGCETSTRLGDLFQSTADTGAATQDDPITTGSVRPPPRDPPAAAKAASDDELKLGKKYFQAGNFSLAERHFRRAVELHPRDLESWIGLAASYDRQRRFDLADRAYDQATKIAGPTVEILNNRGYSYMLRGDPRRARDTLLEAQARDPGNTYIKNNHETVEASLRKSKATQ